MKEYNRKWENGDTFALKINIKDCKFEEYNNKYLIINKIGINDAGNDLVRIKISEIIDFKNALKELNELEYIKVNFFWYEDWRYYISEKNVDVLKKYVNNYNMIFLNVMELAEYSKVKTGEFRRNLIYLGNYILTPPQNEFYPEFLYHLRREFLILDRFQVDMINSYEYINKEKSEAFNKEFAQKQNEIIKGAHILIDEYLKECRSKPNLANDDKIEDTFTIEDTLTYVGGKAEDEY